MCRNPGLPSPVEVGRRVRNHPRLELVLVDAAVPVVVVSVLVDRAVAQAALIPLVPSAILSAPHLRWPHFNRSRLAGFQRPVRDWGKLLGDTAAVTALLDRLLHHAHILKCGPRSWRTKLHSDLPQQEAAR
jgi:hypothetical protein